MRSGSPQFPRNSIQDTPSIRQLLSTSFNNAGNRSSAIWHRVTWQSLPDVSGQTISLIFTNEWKNTTVSRNVWNRLSTVEIKCQLDATDGFFIADLIACSTCFRHHYAHHQELKSIIQVVAACGIWCFGFQSCRSGVELWVVCPVWGMLL